MNSLSGSVRLIRVAYPCENSGGGGRGGGGGRIVGRDRPPGGSASHCYKASWACQECVTLTAVYPAVSQGWVCSKHLEGRGNGSL